MGKLSNTDNKQFPERTPDAPQSEQERVYTNDMLPDEIRDALNWLRRQGATEADTARRGHLKRMVEGEEFWKGNHYGVWSDRDFSYKSAVEVAIAAGKLEDQPTYQYVINVYRAMGLTIIAALSQRLPKVRFLPHSAQREEDIATARAASDIAELAERNNHLKTLARREAYLLWTQGGFGSYVRFVRDPDKGIEDMPIVEQTQVQVSPDSFNCEQCGESYPADTLPGQPTVDEFGQESEMRQCPNCGAPLTAAHFTPAETGTVPVVSGYKQVPEGFEKISVYGFLNLKMAPYVQHFDQSGYLQLVEDVPQGALRAAYPTMANDIGMAGSSESLASDTYEKVARLSLYDAANRHRTRGYINAYQAYLTYSRCWFRSWYLWEHPDEDIRAKLIAMFPDGAYVAFAGDKLLEARNENVDDCWTICSAMPGYGIYSDAIGADTIPLNKQINDAANIVAEHIDFGSAPPVFYDAMYLSGEAMKRQKMRPATMIPVIRERGGSAKSLKDLMHQPDIKLDANVYAYSRELIEMCQMTSGALPSLFGGQLKGNETASAYRQSRDQAMGKALLFWQPVKEHHADAMIKVVDCFRRNRTGDVESVIMGQSGEYKSKYIRLMDLGGNIIAMPEADEDFPATWAEIRDNLNSLLNENPQAAQAMALFEPANASLLKKFVGSPNLVLPSEAAREQQFREIDELLDAAPIEVIDPLAPPDMMTGMPATKFISTIAPDVHAEDHVTHIKAIMEWNSDPNGGVLAKKENPAGHANVLAHLIEHKRAMAEAAAFDQQTQMEFGLMPPPGAPGEEGGGSEGDKGGSKPPAA